VLLLFAILFFHFYCCCCAVRTGKFGRHFPLVLYILFKRSLFLAEIQFGRRLSTLISMCGLHSTCTKKLHCLYCDYIGWCFGYCFFLLIAILFFHFYCCCIAAQANLDDTFRLYCLFCLKEISCYCFTIIVVADRIMEKKLF